MKKLSLFFFLILNTFLIFGQGFQWAKKGGGPEADYGYGLSIDNLNNNYVCGHLGFQNSGTYQANFGSLSISHSFKYRSGYLIKYDSTGNSIWIKHIGSSLGAVNATNVVVDAGGNIFVAGQFDTSVTVDGVTAKTSAYDGVYLAKFLSNGNLVWLISLDQKQSLVLSDMIIDGSGNIWMTGNIDYWTFYLRKYSGNDGTLMKYIESKNTSGGSASGYGLAVNDSNQVIAAGSYSGSCSIGSINLPKLDWTNTMDIFIAKFDNNANLIWLMNAGGSPNADQVFGIGVDRSNNIYIQSVLNDTVSWGNKLLLHTKNWAELYLAKLNSNGKTLWVKAIPIHISGYGGNINHLVIRDELIFNVSYNDTLTIAGKKFSSTGNDRLIIIADTSTKFIGGYEIKGTFSYAPTVVSLVQNSNSEILLSGSFRDIATFGSTPITSTGGDKSDMFLSKIIPCLIPPIATYPAGTINLCSGGSKLISSDTVSDGTYQWYLNDIPIQNATSSFYTVTQPGKYKVEVSKGGGCQSVSKTIVVNLSSINAQIQAQPNVSSICKGDKVQLLTTSVYTSYNWSSGQNGVSFITVGPGTYSVIVSDFNGCTDTAFITIIENPLPNKPDILRSNCLLSSSIAPSGVSYKWWFDNGSGYSIVGSNNSTYNALISGDGFYKLEIKDENECKNISNPFAVAGCGNVGIISANNGELTLFPSPFHGDLTVEFYNNSLNLINLQILDIFGRLISESTLPVKIGKNQFNLSLTNLSKGIYFIMLTGNDNSVSLQKIVKQ